MTTASAATETEITIRHTHFEMDDAQRRRSRFFFFSSRSFVCTFHDSFVECVSHYIINTKFEMERGYFWAEKSRLFTMK